MKNRFGNCLASLSPPNPALRHVSLDASAYALRNPSTRPKGIKVRIRFSDGSVYDQLGVVNFVDVTVDRTTDTVIARATIPNPRGELIDGQPVRVLLESGKPKEEVVIPQSALIADQQGVYVFVVEDGKAVVKRLKLGGETGTNVVVEEGLSAGAQVIVASKTTPPWSD